VPLAPLLERVVSLEIRLDVRLLSAPDVDLLADPDQIEQLLINLVRNAVEAATLSRDEVSSAGEDAPSLFGAETAAAPASAVKTAPPRAPEVTLRALVDGELAAIQIEDNGPGFANPDNLFVPLYTTKKSGSGVGLALARQIVEAHGGEITLRNRGDGPGCLAEVRIPIAEREHHQSGLA
jgi:two-component system, NtrC family, nitrogen regulation sensor histidine kinase NtrY